MTSATDSRSVGLGRGTWLLVLVVALLDPAPSTLAQEDPAGDAGPGYSRLTGKVVRADGKTGVAGAVVVAYHLSTETLHRSEPTRANGDYRIEGLPLGYYDLAVEIPDGFYVGSHIINVPPGGKAIVHFTLTPGDPAQSADVRQEFPGLGADWSGVARVNEKATQRDFWRSPPGVAIMAGTGGVILLAIASESNQQSASAFIP